MITLLQTLSLGYVRQHRTRTILIILSIALGVATLVATQALSRSLKGGIEEGVNPLSRLADLLIMNGDAGVDAALGKELELASVPGVAGVTPFVLTRASLPDLKNRDVWLLGVERPSRAEKHLPGDSDLLGVEIHQTYQPRTWVEKAGLVLAPPALVSEDLAQAFAQADPKRVRFRLRTSGHVSELTRMGTFTFRESKIPLRDNPVVVMDLHTASAICFPEKPGFIHQIGISIVPGEPVEEVRQRVKTWLGNRGEVRTIDTTKQMVSDVTAGLEIGFAIGGAGALVVGLFLVYNALSVSVAERRHDIGILRSVGATRRQIAWLFLGESLLMGLTGSALGLPIGYALARAAVGPMANTITELIVPIENAEVALPRWLIAVALISGTLVAVLAALVPALQAAGEEPADAVRRVPRKHPVLFAVLQIGGMIVLLGAGFALARYREYLPARVGIFAGVVCLVLGGLVATPLFASLVGRFIQPLFRYLLGLEGRLAADNLVRAPGRTGLVIAALAATSGLMVQTSGFLKSTRVAVYDWLEEKIDADLFVTSGSPITAGGSATTLPESFAEELKKLPGVQVVMPVRMLQIEFQSPRDASTHILYLVALDSAAFRERGQERSLGRSLAKFPRLREPHTVVVSENFAALYRVNVGDHISIPGDGGTPIDVEVIGLATDYTWNRGTILMDRRNFKHLYRDNQVSVFDLFLEPGTDSAALQQEVMARYGDKYNLFILNRPEIHADVRKTLQRVYSFAYAQQGVVGLVALLGVVTALFISVLQRRRELGLLRAVGATRAQILRSVLAEAVLMGLVGAMVGFAIGLLLEWYVIDILIFDESGFKFPMRIPWLEAGVVSLASVVFATLAGLWPAYHATTLRIPEAIAYE
ncbi:MAG: FtsX-like permease family protein [Gemmataceae bacterium]